MPSRREWPETMRKIAEERIELSARKNANYSGGELDADAFKNFNLVEIVTNGKISREAGIFVRMVDKVARLGNVMFGEPDQVGESVEDTLKDLANYSDIALQAWREKHSDDGAQLSFDFDAAVEEEKKIAEDIALNAAYVQNYSSNEVKSSLWSKLLALKN